MKLADLFINLGVKGTEKTVGAFTGMQKGLKDTKSLALETKVALLAAVYALERLFSASGQKGTDLTNFNSLIGVSTKTLQQYEYAARQVGVSNAEVDGTFKSLQATMTKTLMGEGAPKGLARVAQLTGGMTPEDLKQFAEKPDLLIQKLQEYAGKEQNKGLKNEVLKSFGVSDNMISALNRKAFRPDVMAKAPTYSEKEVGSLDKANIAWSNLQNKIEMAVGKFNSKHGTELVDGISKITDKVLKLAEAFTVFAEKMKLFEWFGKAIEGWTQILSLFTEGVGAATGAMDDPKKADSLKKNVGNFFTSEVPTMFSYLMGGDTGGAKNATPGKETGSLLSNANKAAVQPNAAPVASGNQTQNINVNQNLNFQHDGKDAKKTGDSVKKAVRDAYRANPAQAGGF